MPQDYPDLHKIIDRYHLSHSILGVCLGHQAIATYFKNPLKNLKLVKHGVSNELNVIDDQCLFKNLPVKFQIAHYHSWNVKNVNKELIISAIDEENEIMAFRHKTLKIFGIQFHPESVLTEHGLTILNNWLSL